MPIRRCVRADINPVRPYGFPNPLLPIHGYVLAGGKSSRMGTDKATLIFQGAPLIQQAVEKLRLFCPKVAILGNRPDLAEYAETVPDRVPEAGPLAAIEAALHHTSLPWLFLLPVDVPLLPASFLAPWVLNTLLDPLAPRANFFEVDGRPQPLVALLHRSLAPFIREALDRGERKVLPALESAAVRAAPPGSRHLPIRIDLPDDLLWEPLLTLTLAEQTNRPLWFANLNTPGDLKKAEAHLNSLQP